MNKLFNFKKWLTLEETANYLGIKLGDTVSKADVIRLGLDGHLRLSVHFVNGSMARPLLPVQLTDVEFEEVPGLDGGTVQLTKGGPLIGITRGWFQIAQVVSELEDSVWDLPLIGAERFDVEQEYQSLTGGPAVELINIDGAFVESSNGGLHQLQEHYADNKHFNKENLKKPFHHVDNYHPSPGLPKDSVLVIRTDTLREFEESINGVTGSKEKALSTNERNTLLTIIAALCDYSAIKHQERGTASQIATMTQEIGAAITDDTIRKILAKIPDALEARSK